MFIETIPEHEATGPVAELYDADRDRLGYVPNFTRVFAHRPAVYAAWKQLSAAIAEAMGERRYELVTLAAARRLRSSYCMLAHGKLVAERFLDPGQVVGIAAGKSDAGLVPADVAAMGLAEKIVDDATSVTDADLDRLRICGLSDADILDVVLAAAVRCFFSKVLDAVGAQADPAFAELEQALRDALTVGRPIAER
jgi:uncharacterized peroxidase-related enzyme